MTVTRTAELRQRWRNEAAQRGDVAAARSFDPPVAREAAQLAGSQVEALRELRELPEDDQPFRP